MQTRFSDDQLQDSDTATANAILRSCVHCGFCTATCPTYVTLGDELDSPRGRIYLIKEMFETGAPASAPVAEHLDRCLSCLSCATACPSGVDYMHLIDMARVHVETTYRRPLPERMMRAFLGTVLPRPALFRASLYLAALARPFKALLPKMLHAALALAPRRLPPADPAGRPQVFPASGARTKRVALLAGCAQQVLEPSINAATIRLLNRLGVEVVTVRGSSCCGALQHHLGQDAAFRDTAQRTIAAWTAEADAHGLDAILVNASGCGSVIKDYGFIFRDDPEWSARAARVSALCSDISQFLAGFEMRAVMPTGQAIAYHSACALQHGQHIDAEPRQLLRDAGFRVVEIAERHLCCGSAGTYNLLQPEISATLRDRKLAHIAKAQPQAVATGNIGCITQLRAGAGVPVLHTVELLDWATGGPMPDILRDDPRF